MKLLIFTLVSLFQFTQACIVEMEGIYTPGNGHMAVHVWQQWEQVCELNEFIKGKRDPYWLNCKDGKHAWISQDGKSFAYAANGVDYKGVPKWTPLHDADNNQGLYWSAC